MPLLSHRRSSAMTLLKLSAYWRKRLTSVNPYIER